MTLTTILPSLRRSIPDPLSIDRWPEHTVATTTDVLVAGISLIRLVELCGTPCVHTAAAVVPGTHGRPSPTNQACVVIVRVTEVERMADSTASTDDPVLRAVVDGELGHAHPVADEARVVGRISTARRVWATLAGTSLETAEAGPFGSRTASRPLDPPLVLPVPADLGVGDLIAVPCIDTVPLRMLREHPPASPRSS